MKLSSTNNQLCKKKFYSDPKLYLLELTDENKKLIIDGDIILKSLNQINNNFESVN